MHKLGDQWIEIIDGQEHMLKVVDSTDNCNGCTFLGDSGICLHSSILEFECPVYYIDAIIKDLGILNEYGCLPCPFCGEYPMLFENENVEEKIVHGVAHYAFTHEIVMTDEKDTDDVRHWFYTEQEAIDAWNRRA